MPHAVVIAAEWVAVKVGMAVAVGLGGGTAAVAAGTAVVSAITALGFASGIGAGISAWATVASIAGAVAGQRKPKIGQSASGTQLDFKVDLNAPAPLVLGRTATGGFVVHRNSDGAALKNAHVMFCNVLSFGPVQNGVEKVIANGDNVSFSGEPYGGGPCSTGTYAGNMDLRVQLGVKPEAVFPYPSVPAGSLPEWTSAHKLSGWHAVWWSLNYNQTVYAQGVPRALFVTTGPAVYDPRLDSTYSGGSGANRPNTESTWSWSGNTNPFLQGLTWALGRYANSKRIFGAGVPVAAIDRAAFVEGANVAETNGWTIGGVVTSGDRKWDALVAMLQAGGGRPMRLGGQLSCMVAAPRVSLATVTGDDIVGEVTISGTSPRRDRINTIIPRFRSEDHNWEMVAGDPVSVSTYVTEDGGKRTREVEFGLVQNKTQAAQLAAYSIVDSREFGPIVLPLKPKWLGYKPGDCLTITEPEIGLNAQKVIIRSRQFDPGTGVVTLTCWSETDAKHDFALGLSGTAPPTPGLTGIDLALAAPASGVWTLTGTTIAATDGDIPALVITGTPDNKHAASLLVRYRIYGSSDWIGPIVTPITGTSAMRVEVTGIVPGTTYEVSVAYRSVRGIDGAWRSLSSAVSGDYRFTALDNALSDGVLTPSEKNIIIPFINALIAARTNLRTRATALNLLTSNNAQRLAYENAATALDASLATLTSPVIWSSVADNTTVSSPSGFRTAFQNAISTERNLQTVIDETYEIQISDVTTRVDDLDVAVSDGVFTPAEKMLNIPVINSMIFARAKLRVSADAMGLTTGSSTERAAFETAATTLDSTLAALTSPVAWNNYTDQTTIASPSTFRAALQAAYATTFDLQSAVDAIAAGRTTYLGSDGRVISVTATPINMANGRGMVMSLQPLSSDGSSISIAAFELSGVGFSKSFPAATITGLGASTPHKIFATWKATPPYYTAQLPSASAPLLESDDWYYVGEISTSDGSGVFPTITPDPGVSDIGSIFEFNSW